MKISDGILRQAVLLSERYITDRFLPDKAIDLIDEACSDLNLKDPDISRRMQLQRELDDFEKERSHAGGAGGAGGRGDGLRAAWPTLKSRDAPA